MKKFAVLLSLCALGSVQAQTIERVKMTDNDLNCQQVYNEITMMDGVIARGAQAPAAAVAAAPVPGADGGAGSQMVGAVAQTALSQVAGRGGFGGFGGGLSNLGGGLGGLFGGLVQQGAAAQQVSAQQAAAQQAAAQQQQMQAAGQGAGLGQQAQGRKEHLTGMFLSKGCRMSDIQK